MGSKPSLMLKDEEIRSISEETGFTWAQVERLYIRFETLDKSGVGSLSKQNCYAIPELAINPLCDRIVHIFFLDCDPDYERINFRQFMRVLASFRSSSCKTPRPSSISAAHSKSLSGGLSELDQQSKNQMMFDSMSRSSFPKLSFARHFRHFSFNDSFGNDGYRPNRHDIFHTKSFNHLSRQNGVNDSMHDLRNQHRKAPIMLDDEPINGKRRKVYYMFKIYDINDDNLLDLDDLTATLKMLVGHYVDEITLDRIAERSFSEIDKNHDGFIDFDEFCTFAFSRFDDDSLKVKFPVSA